MKEKDIWKKRRLIVSPAFQWSIVLKITLFTIVVSALFGWFSFYFLWKSSISQGNLTQVEMLYQPGLWIGWAGCMLLCIFIVSLILLKITHRIAGQMYRFEKALDAEICGERFSPVHTRKDDYFHEFEADLNRYLNKEN